MPDDPILPFLLWNEIALLIVVSLMLALYGHAIVTERPVVLLYSRHPSTASSFWFYFAGSLCLLVFYAVSYSSRSFGRPNSLLLSVCTDLLVDLVSLCTLAAAWAYGRARDFSVSATLLSFVLAAVLLFIWYLAWKSVGTKSLFSVLLEQAPGIVLAVVSTTALGWVFFSRWGGFVGGLYLLLRVGYGVLQLPANIRFDINDYLVDKGASLDISFGWLAVGKVALGILFLSLLCRSNFPDVDQPSLAPQVTAEVSAQVRYKAFRDAVILAIIMAVIASPLPELWCSYFPAWCVWRH